jgi:Lar family restriction alleviation protein
MNDKTAKIEFEVQLQAKACPFCGSWDLRVRESKDSDYPMFVQCNSCGSDGPNEAGAIKAVERWNERKSPGPVPEDK